MLLKFALALSALIAGLLLYATSRPDSFRVERKISISAPPETIAAAISNFRNWRTWSPYENRDTSLQRQYSGAENGVGAVYAWQGNSQVGSGRMEILSATPQEIRIQLDFFKPFTAHNTAIFRFTPQGSNTEVSWAMEGPLPYFAKIMHLFFNMDKMVGGDFEVGLSNLKQISESQP